MTATGAVAVQAEDLSLLCMTGLLERGCGKFRGASTRIMLLQNMPRIFPDIFEFKGKEHGPGFEVAKLKNEQHTVRQIVVCVGQRAFFRGKTEEV
jgi:hypothetical protein